MHGIRDVVGTSPHHGTVVHALWVQQTAMADRGTCRAANHRQRRRLRQGVDRKGWAATS